MGTIYLISLEKQGRIQGKNSCQRTDGKAGEGTGLRSGLLKHTERLYEVTHVVILMVKLMGKEWTITEVIGALIGLAVVGWFVYYCITHPDPLGTSNGAQKSLVLALIQARRHTRSTPEIGT